MSISIYSVLTTFLWFNLFVLLLCFLRWKLKIILGYSLLPLSMLLILSTMRLLLPLEPSFAIVLRSEQLLPLMQTLLRTKVITIGSTNITLAMLVVLVLLIVSVVRIAHILLLIHRMTQRMATYTQTDDIRVLSIFERIQEESPSRRKCHLCVSNHDSWPCIWGLTYSIVILPEEALLLSDQDLYYILKHEWQHHIGNDVAVKLFIEILCCVTWWNPPVFLLKHNLNQTLELKCDENVMKQLRPEQRVDYAEALVNVIKLCTEKEFKASREELIAIPFLGSASSREKRADINIIQRLDAMLEFNRPNGKIPLFFCTCLILLFVFSFCFVLQPYSLPPEEDLLTSPNSEAVIELLEVTPETSLLVDNQDGTYSLFVDGEYWRDITAKERTREPYQALPITTIT